MWSESISARTHSKPSSYTLLQGASKKTRYLFDMFLFSPILSLANPLIDTAFSQADVQYAQGLQYLAKNRDEIIFNNSKPTHAAIVMEHIFRETIKNGKGGEIRIYAKNMNGEISKYDNYRYSLLQYLLANDTQLKVIVDSEPESVSSETNAFDLLRTFSKTEKIGHKIHIRKVTNSLKVDDLMQNFFELKDVHFAVSSENMYRFEIDSSLHFAECCFNGKEKSDQLISVFDTMFDNKNDNYTAALSAK